jgi:diphosphomevalonate decarboxylase
LHYSPARLSAWARRGSGSAARSIYGGFVEMNPGKKADGSDALAKPLYDREYWPLEVLVFITSRVEKATGSGEGMKHTANTSPYYQGWIHSAPGDLSAMRQALERKDFQRLGEIAEFSCLKMHGLMMSALPGLLYWNGLTVTLIHEIRRLRRQGIPAYFTVDGGPQVKIICLPGYSRRIKEELQHIDGVQEIIVTALGPDARIIDG